MNPFVRWTAARPTGLSGQYGLAGPGGRKMPVTSTRTFAPVTLSRTVRLSPGASRSSRAAATGSATGTCPAGTRGPGQEPPASTARPARPGSEMIWAWATAPCPPPRGRSRICERRLLTNVTGRPGRARRTVASTRDPAAAAPAADTWSVTTITRLVLSASERRTAAPATSPAKAVAAAASTVASSTMTAVAVNASR